MAVTDRKTARLFVDSEVGDLKRVLVHSPDAGIGKVVPKMHQDYLYDDIVDIKKMRQEYDVFKQVLLAFLDPLQLAQWFSGDDGSRLHVIPGTDRFIDSKNVVEVQVLLAEVLEDTLARIEIVASVCSIEGCDYKTQKELMEEPESHNLAKTLITGLIRRPHAEDEFLFPPIPNFLFTRDLGVVLGDRLILSKASKSARMRESLLFKYIAYYSLCSGNESAVVEVKNDRDYLLSGPSERRMLRTTLEGGDIMVVSKTHVIIGCSERTSASAIEKIIETLFTDIRLEVAKISVVNLPKSRSTMHLDTILTHVRRDLWVVDYELSREGTMKSRWLSLPFEDRGAAVLSAGVEIVQFEKTGAEARQTRIMDIEELLTTVSIQDYGCQRADFVYCGNRKYPYTEREQWADGCNLLTLREGVVLAYDRNELTCNAFEEAGFTPMPASDFISALRNVKLAGGSTEPLERKRDEMVGKNAIILLPSTELLRARGGSHCLSMPLLRGHVSQEQYQDRDIVVNDKTTSP